MKYISVLVFKKDAVSFTAFLLSPRASYVSGAILNIDGGTDF